MPTGIEHLSEVGTVSAMARHAPTLTNGFLPESELP